MSFSSNGAGGVAWADGIPAALVWGVLLLPGAVKEKRKKLRDGESNRVGAREFCPTIRWLQMGTVPPVRDSISMQLNASIASVRD